MWSDKLVGAILERRYSNAWPEKFKTGFEALFGSEGGRYPDSAKRHVTLRAPAPPEDSEGIIPFGALIHPSNPSTGPYGGTSLAVFPGDDTPCMISLVVGTNGLAPDEEILGRPGHARKAAAVCAWLNSGQRKLVAWSKHDPTAWTNASSRGGRTVWEVFEGDRKIWPRTLRHIRTRVRQEQDVGSSDRIPGPNVQRARCSPSRSL